jgi:hypothetical protein
VEGLQRIGVQPVPGRYWVQADGSYGVEGNPSPLGNLRALAQAFAQSQGSTGGVGSLVSSEGSWFRNSDGSFTSFTPGVGTE